MGAVPQKYPSKTAPESTVLGMTRADLVDVEFVDDVVEDGPQIVEEVDNLHRSALRGECRERHDVREIDGRLLVQFHSVVVVVIIIIIIIIITAVHV